MRFIKNQRKTATINITSLIDVMFLLVIFVMLAARFENDYGVKVDLPQGVSRENNKPPQVLDLAILPDGSYRLDGDVVTLDNIQQVIREKTAASPVAPPVQLRIDKAATGEQVVQAVDRLIASGVVRGLAFRVNP